MNLRRLRLFRFAAGDYAKKYLPKEPILARKGEPGYDPNVEREVKAALAHRPPSASTSDKAIRRHYRKLGKTAILKSGYAPMEVVAGGEGGKKRFMPLVKIVHPYRKIKSQIAQQQRSLTEEPKAPPPPPPEMLSKHGGRKTPVRGGDYEGVVLPGNDLWDREAAKPGKIKYTYPNRRQHPHQRKALTPEEVSVKAREQRNPIASHEARVKAGLTKNLIVKREDKITGLPNTYLPKPADLEERRQSQAIRDHLAGRLKSLRRETIQPMRNARRKALGLPLVKPMSKQKIEAIRKSSEGITDLPIAPNAPVQKPIIKPMVPIPGGEVHPNVVNRYHQVLKERTENAKTKHLNTAHSIRQDIHTKLQEQFSKLDHPQHGQLLRDTSRRLTNETFNANRTYMEDWEVKALAEHTGTTPDWIKAQHKTFVKHTFLGSSHAGEEKIRKGLNLKRFTNVPAAAEATAPAYPALKRLGKRVGVGGGIAAGVIGASVLTKKLLDRRRRNSTTNFSVKSVLLRKLSDSAKRRLVAGGTLTGGIAAADAVVSGVHPDPEKNRKQSAWAGAKRGALYGAVLAGTEQVLHKPFRKILFASKREDDFRRDVTIGGIEGGAGVVATDRLIRKFVPEGSGLQKKILIGAGVGGLATGTIGYAINRLIRKRQHQRQTTLSSFARLHQFRSIVRSGKAVFHDGSKLDVEALVRKVGDRAATSVKMKSLKSLPRTRKSGFSEKRVARSNIYRPVIVTRGKEVVDGRHRVVRKGRMGRTHVQAIQVTAKDLKAVKMNSKTPHIRFADGAYPPAKRRRLTVAQDRYRKQIRGNEIDRHTSNLARSAAAGGILGGVLRSSKKGIIPGAIAGTATSALLISRNRKRKDVFGDSSISVKREERLPYQAAGLTAAGILAHKLYRKFSNRGHLIKFQQFIPVSDNSTPWHKREAARWINHPRGRVENAQKWLARAGRLHRDSKLTRTSRGQIIDERGRQRDPEWEKGWFKRSVYGGAAVGALVGGALIHKRIKTSAVTAAGLMGKGVRPSEWERLSLNIASGNVGRAVRGKIKSKFPKITTGVKKASQLGDEFRTARDSFLRKGNEAVEGQTGHITSASIKKNKLGHITGVDVDNPAKARENLDKIQAQEEKINRRAEQLRRQRERIQKTQGTRGRLEGILKPKDEERKLSSRSQAIEFDDVYVRPHVRSARRNKYKHEKKDFREGLLIGGGVGLGGLGLGGGLAYKARKDALGKKFTEETEEHISKRVAQEMAKLRVLRKLNSNLDSIIAFTAN